MEIYRGDIFYIEDNYRTEGSEQRPGRPALVVSNNTGNYHSDIVSIVWLTTAEKKDLPTHCKILCKTLSTAICEQVVTISQNRLGEYIRTVTEKEMKAIDKCLMIALGLKPDVTCNESDESQVADLEMMLKCAEKASEERRLLLEDSQKQLSDAIHHIEVLNFTIEQLETELAEKNNDPAEVIALKAQLEVYKEQNDRMFNALMGA